MYGLCLRTLPFSPTSSGIIHYSHSTTQYRNLRRLAQLKCKDGIMALFCQVCINGLVFNFGSVYIRPQAPADVFDQVLTHLGRVASLPFPLGWETSTLVIPNSENTSGRPPPPT